METLVFKAMLCCSDW